MDDDIFSISNNNKIDFSKLFVNRKICSSLCSIYISIFLALLRVECLFFILIVRFEFERIKVM